MCSVFKTDARRAKTKHILGSVGEVFGVLVLHRVLLTAKFSRALYCHLFSSDSDIRPPCISKMAGRRAEQQTLGTFEVSLVYTGYALLLNIQGKSAVKPCIPIFGSCIPKMAGHRAKWMKVWALWSSYLVYTGYW